MLKNLLMGAGLVAVAACAAGSRPRVLTRLVNPAVEERDNPIWQRAHAEILGGRLVSETGAGLIERGNRRAKEVALTFDDGPHGADTVKLLDILRKEGVPATFFVIGKMAIQHPDNVRMEVADGDEVGNHTFSHVTLTKLSQTDIETELKACSDVVESITGKRPQFCRPPGGDWDDSVVDAAAKLGMSTVLWTDDPGDYNDPGDSVVVDRTLGKATNGGIILLHDGSVQTLQILPELISSLRERGFKFVTMSQLEADRNERRPSILAGFRGRSPVPVKKRIV